MNSTHKGMLSPNTENTVSYWQILEEESVDLDRIKLRETELNYLKRERKVREMEMEKLGKERLEIKRIIEEKLERDKLERVELYDNQSREDNNLSGENIQDDELQAMRASLFPFGMVQTPFQIMLNWPVKFGNNTDDSPTIFLNNLLSFERGYKINDQDSLENLDAVLIGEAQSWYQVNKRNWHNLENFIQEFKQVYLNEKYLEVIHNKIKFCNQKKNQEIHSFIIEMRKLFEKLEPLASLGWQLKKFTRI